MGVFFMTFDEIQAQILSLSTLPNVDFFTVGYSLLGKPVYGVHIGNYDGNQLLIEGAIHAREYLTSLLIVDQVKYLYNKPINGGIYFSDEFGIVISIMMFVIGALFALKKCRTKGGKSTYLSLITIISAFALILVSALKCDCDLTIILYGYALLLLSASPRLKGCEKVFSVVGKLCFLILKFVVTYQGLWGYNAEFDSVVFLIMTILLILFAIS